jgi:adenosylhomocysteine nucleosidase
VDVTLVVAATEAEAAHVPPHLPLVITGLGKTAAAVATTRALAGMDAARTCVVNVGTAGALHDGLEGLHLPGVVLNHDMNAEAIRALGYDPEERLLLDNGDGTVLAQVTSSSPTPRCGPLWRDEPTSSTWRGTRWPTRVVGWV